MISTRLIPSWSVSNLENGWKNIQVAHLFTDFDWWLKTFKPISYLFFIIRCRNSFGCCSFSCISFVTRNLFFGSGFNTWSGISYSIWPCNKIKDILQIIENMKKDEEKKSILMQYHLLYHHDTVQKIEIGCRWNMSTLCYSLKVMTICHTSFHVENDIGNT